MSPESAGGLGSWLVSGQSRQDARAASIDAVNRWIDGWVQGEEVIWWRGRFWRKDGCVWCPESDHFFPQRSQGWDLPEEFGTLRRVLESRTGRRGKREFRPGTAAIRAFFAWGGPRRGSGCPPVIAAVQLDQHTLWGIRWRRPGAWVGASAADWSVRR